MKKYLIIIFFFALVSCKDNKKIIQESKIMHGDSASIDSLKFEKLKKQDEKLNGILLNGRFYSTGQLDSIFAGKK